jgi:hypothetical protein
MYLAFVFLTDGYLLQIGGFENIGGTDMPHWEKRSLPLLNHSLDTFQKRVDAEAAEDPPFGTPLVRAGTVLFAPVQNFLHAGVSAGGHVCDLTGLKERLVVLFTLVPTPLLGVFLAHKELSLESRRIWRCGRRPAPETEATWARPRPSLWFVHAHVFHTDT